MAPQYKTELQMRKSVIYLLALQLLFQAKTYAYESESECIKTLTSNQSDTSLVKMICASAIYKSPQTDDDKKWEKEKEELRREALTEIKQNEAQQTWERLKNRQERIRQELAEERMQQQQEKAEAE